VGDWACSEHLIRSTHDWPDDWVLVCHTRYRPKRGVRAYVDELSEMARTDQVVFSTEPLPHREYPALVQSADVGIVFYCVQPGSTYQQDNLVHIGLSSGKLAYFLQAGVPVVVSDQPSLRRLATTYQCGEVAADPALTRPAIVRILADYETYSRNAVTCFNQELDFSGGFAQVLAALERL
jgi:hypothetical protein